MQHHPHEMVVCGLFDSRADVDRALAALKDEPIDPDDISVITTPAAYEKEESVTVLGVSLHPEAVRAAKFGAGFGLVVAGAAAWAAVAMSGGSVLASLPVIGFIAVAGGLLGALIGAGFTDEEAKAIDQEIREGKTMLAVHAEKAELSRRVRAVLAATGGHRVHLH